jgi:hypothetical protein
MDLIEACFERGWTDGLPVVPPTRSRVERMLGDRIDEARQEVAVLAPSGGVATLEKIAANAVMAGCEPGHLPIVEAAVRAVAHPAFKLDRVMTTASSQAPMLLVTGPIVREQAFDGGFDALGSSERANASVGRALQLVLRNVASLRAGGLPHATIGHPGHRGFCFVENHELSPWLPYHEDRGFTAGSSAVTVYPAEAPLCVVDMGRTEPELVLRTIVESATIPGTYNTFFREEFWFVLSPQHAQLFASAGWTRDDLRTALHEQLRLPAERLRERGLYGYIDELVPPVWLEDSDPIPLVDDPDRIRIAVSGGPFGGYTAVIFGEGVSITRSITTDTVGEEQ